MPGNDASFDRRRRSILLRTRIALGFGSEPGIRRWSNTLAGALRPEVAEESHLRDQHDYYAGFTATGKGNAGDPYGEYAEWMERRFAVDPTLFGELWDLAVRGLIDLPYPGRTWPRIEWRAPGALRGGLLSFNGRGYDTLIFAEASSGAEAATELYLALETSGAKPLVVTFNPQRENLAAAGGIDVFAATREGDDETEPSEAREWLAVVLGAFRPRSVYAFDCPIFDSVLIGKSLNFDGPICHGLWRSNETNMISASQPWSDLPYLEPGISTFLAEDRQAADRLSDNGVPQERVRIFGEALKLV